MVDITIIIISWKMKAALHELLCSVAQHTVGVTYEMIVVDNHSGDGTAEMVRAEFPDARLIENAENRGVAPSRNQALRLAKGRYALLLDADMLLIENSFKQMVEFMDRTDDAGICGCKLISPDHAVQPSARRYPSPLAFVLRRLAFLDAVRRSPTLYRHEMADWDRSDVRDVDYVIGACQMIRSDALRQVGLLDEAIFYGPEDIDYCMRMYRSGWKVYYYPHTRIIHYEQRITKKKLFSKISFRHLQGIIHLFLKYKGKLRRNGNAIGGARRT
jgi:N-acetylglucosaminyl-diphospho-decaprenol L-rhamnosyltransferase